MNVFNTHAADFLGYGVNSAALNPANNFYMPKFPQMQQQGFPGVTYQLVHGIDQVKQFSVVPGASAILFDDEQNEFYIKNVDKMGMQSLRKFEYKEVALPSSGGASAICDNGEVEQLRQRVAALEQILTSCKSNNSVQDIEQKANNAVQSTQKGDKK